MNLGSEMFEIRNFLVHSNTKWKIYTFFDIQRSKVQSSVQFFLGGSEIQSSVSEDEPRF